MFGIMLILPADILQSFVRNRNKRLDKTLNNKNERWETKRDYRSNPSL